MHVKMAMLYFLAPFLLLVTTALSRNPQLCYYGAGKLAAEDIVPCYTTTYVDHYWCCKAGSMCLDHNACYDGSTGITYQYGCDDPTFQHASCPEKCGLDMNKSSWVGLVYCNGTDGMPNNTWVCHHPDNCGNKEGCNTRHWDSELEKLPYVTCKDLKHDGQYVPFEQAGPIRNNVQLPPQSELSSYYSAHSDRTKSTERTTIESTGIASTSPTDAPSPSYSGSSVDATPTLTGTNPTQTTSKSGRNHTIAMAIGFGAGIPVIIAAIGTMIFYFRRRRNVANASDSSYKAEKSPTGSTSADGTLGYSHKVELSGEDRPIYEAPGSPLPTELEGSTVGERSPTQSAFVSPMTVQSEYSTNGEWREHRVSRIQDRSMCELAG